MSLIYQLTKNGPDMVLPTLVSMEYNSRQPFWGAKISPKTVQDALKGVSFEHSNSEYRPGHYGINPQEIIKIAQEVCAVIHDIDTIACPVINDL